MKVSVWVSTTLKSWEPRETQTSGQEFDRTGDPMAVSPRFDRLLAIQMPIIPSEHSERVRVENFEDFINEAIMAFVGTNIDYGRLCTA